MPAKTKENQEIIALKEKGESFADIGEKLGISKQAVHERYKRHTE